MRRNRRFLFKFFVATSLLALLPFGVARWQRSRPKTPYTFPVPELAALDKVVQARFAVVPTRDFGAERIGKRHEVFMPQTTKEKAVVATLKQHGYEVVFYVAGRGYLKNKPYWLPLFLQGPIFITRAPQTNKVSPYTYYPVQPNTGFPSATPLPGLPGGHPAQSPLKAPAQKALRLFETSEGTDFQSGDWQIAARPVRASKQLCADCHNMKQVGRRGWPFGTYEELKVGDTLGVAMYAYRKQNSQIKP